MIRPPSLVLGREAGDTGAPRAGGRLLTGSLWWAAYSPPKQPAGWQLRGEKGRARGNLALCLAWQVCRQDPGQGLPWEENPCKT